MHCPRTCPWKNCRIQSGSNLGSLGYESYSLPLSNADLLSYWVGSKLSFRYLVFLSSNTKTDLLKVTQQNFSVHSLSNDKILDGSKLKGFADNKMNATQITISVCGRVENILENRENAGNQHFLKSHNGFKTHLVQGHQKISYEMTNNW